MANTELRNTLKLKVKRFLYFLFKPEIQVIADSHGVALREINFLKEFGIKANFCVVPGATASGLANPNSKTKAYPIFKKFIQRYSKKNDFFIIQLGEVDCGFTIWYKAMHENLEPYKVMEKTLNTYFDFVKKIISLRSKNIIICSAILPTIKDGTNFGEVSNLRREVKTTQFERTNLTLNFNYQLKEFADSNKLYFMNLDELLLDKEKGIIKDCFLNNDITDHHPDPNKISKLYIKVLKSLNIFNQNNINGSK